MYVEGYTYIIAIMLFIRIIRIIFYHHNCPNEDNVLEKQ